MAVTSDNVVRPERVSSTDRVNNNAQGWGIAAFIVLLAILANAFIYVVHKNTYKSPNDPTNVTAPQEVTTPTAGH